MSVQQITDVPMCVTTPLEVIDVHVEKGTLYNQTVTNVWVCV